MRATLTLMGLFALVSSSAFLASGCGVQSQATGAQVREDPGLANSQREMENYMKRQAASRKGLMRSRISGAKR